MGPTAPHGYSVRSVTLDDADAITELLAAYEIADFGRADAETDLLLEGWSRPRFDIANDAWMVTSADEAVVGYAEVYAEEPGVAVEAFARVHPDHHGRGIGRRLVELTERRARTHLANAPTDTQTRRVQNVLSSTDSAAQALLTHCGYSPIRHFWHMEIELGDDPPDADPPMGISIRKLGAAESDRRAVHAVMEESFKDHWGYAPVSFEEWSASPETSDPGLCFVAATDDRVVGALLGRIIEQRGWVMDLGVLQAWRGRGIGGALLRRSFAEFKRRGIPHVTLNVDAANETGAVALYERVGMRVRRSWDVYAKRLAQATYPRGRSSRRRSFARGAHEEQRRST